MAQPINWTNKLVLEFIELYKNERVLWDPTDAQYRRADEIGLAWNRIRSYSKFNNCCVKDLKKKKESLLTTYRLLKFKKRKNPKHRTFWFAFAALESFLGSKYESESSNQMEEDCSSQDCQSEESYESSDHDKPSEPNVIPMEEKNVAIYKPQSSKSKKTLTLTLQGHNNRETNALSVNKRAFREETDEDDLYVQLLAKKMKKLDEQQRDLAMHEIDNIMFRIKMQSGNEYNIEQNYSSSSSPYTMKPQLILVQNSAQYGDDTVAIQNHDVQQQGSS